MDHASLARQTLKSLEERLRQLHLVIYGDVDQGDEATKTQLPPENIASRVQSLEKVLEAFESQSASVQELLRLDKQQTVLAQADGSDVENGQLAATIVLVHASQYSSLASQLRSIHDAPIADASACVTAIAQTPRMELAARRAQQHQLDMAELRKRSAEVVGRWHNVGVLSLNAALNEWEERLMDAERIVRQAQARRQREIEVV